MEDAGRLGASGVEYISFLLRLNLLNLAPFGVPGFISVTACKDLVQPVVLQHMNHTQQLDSLL